MKTGRKTDDGFTLIELIVVIAIIAVLTGVIIVSINPIQSTAAKKAATNMKDALLQGKQYAMTRGNTGTYMKISNGDDLSVIYYVNKSEVGTDIISSRKVSVSYKVGNKNLTGSTVYVMFDKGSGSCNGFTAEEPENGQITKSNDSLKRSIYITAGGVTYRITASGLTGKIDMERE